MIDSSQALQQLREGNARFLKGTGTCAEYQDPVEMAADQSPATIILGCSDSRVAPEIILDQPLGELFVVRTAGNTASPDAMASIEFALALFGSPLVLVLGHSGCGAVEATIGELRDPTPDLSRNLKGLVDRMTPGIKSARPDNGDADLELWMQQGVRANISATIRHLSQKSGPIKAAVQAGRAEVIGAEYSLVSGVVTFF